MDHPIHLFVPSFRTDEVLGEIRECLERGWTGLGYKTVEIEQAWRSYTGLPHAHFLNSGTAGLHLAFKLLKESGGWDDGDEVITTPLTFVSTNHAILYENLKPVFADIDEHLCLDPASVAEKLSPRTRAVCFVGLGGNVGRYAEVLAFCRQQGLRLILDATHMAGTWIGDKHAGWDADVAVFSFHSVKNLPTADAGMVCFARSDLDQAARKLSWLGIDRDTYSRTFSGTAYKWRYKVEETGFKYHGNSITAAMALVALRYLEEDNEYRRTIARWYDEQLAGCPNLESVPMASGCKPSRHLYQVLAPHRDETIVGLNQQSIYPGVHYADNTGYPMYSYAWGQCPRAAEAAQRVLSLPIHLQLRQEDVHRVAAALRSLMTSSS